MASISDLLAELDAPRVVAYDAGAVTSVCHDSRSVTPGAAFVALSGLRTDGHRYLAQAVENGAALLVVQRDRETGWRPFSASGVSVVAVEDTRRALAGLAAAFYGRPAERLRVVGVTGTDGKTTTTHLTTAVLETGGMRTGYASTAARRTGGDAVPNDTHMTTPDAVEVQRLMAEAQAGGADAFVIECSSHGLDQGRLDRAEFDVAVFTNLATDHLDYHGTLERYVEAKGHLFDLLRSAADKGVAKTAVVNADDAQAEYFRKRAGTGWIDYGLAAPAAVRAGEIELDGWETRFRLRTPGRDTAALLHLPGLFNVSNALAAASAGLALGLDVETVRAGLASVRCVPGRMERVESGRPFSVVVDYAHTPHGLQEALTFLRNVTSGRLIAVFGAAGDRDPARREGMGRISAELADYTVVTSEDRWTEPAETVMAGVAEGLAGVGRREGHEFVRISDRREAIAHAIDRAQPGDTVLVAGMGSQQSMIVDGSPVPWSDRHAVNELLRET